MQKFRCRNSFNLPRSFDVSTGSCNVRETGLIFVVTHRKKKTFGRFSPYFCNFCVLGVVFPCGKEKIIYLQSFLGLTDPFSMLLLFLATTFILAFSSKGVLNLSQIVLIAAVITVCIAILTFISTSLSPMGRDGKNEVEDALKTVCEQTS